MYEAREQLPGVKETVITIVFSPSHFLCSTMMFAWVNTSYKNTITDGDSTATHSKAKVNGRSGSYFRTLVLGEHVAVQISFT